MKILTFIKKLFSNNKQDLNIKEYDKIANNTCIDYKKYKISPHEDIVNLLWFGDGPNQNYYPEEESETFKINKDISLRITMNFELEPSCIYMNMPINKVTNINSINPPGYFPSFSALSKEQRYIYALFLEDPYNIEFDISYVFILYYGLERFIFTKKYEEAFNIILKLRDIHLNSSFQSYSLDALFLCCLINKREDLFKKLSSYLNNRNEMSYIYLMSKYIFNNPLNVDEIIALSSAVGFNNSRYIDTEYELFRKTLEELLINYFDGKEINISQYNIENAKNNFHLAIANYSLNKDMRFLELPNVLSIKELKDSIYSILSTTHNYVKAKLEAERRLGKDLSSNKYAIMLSSLTIVDLKDILDSKTLKKTGKKAELIECVINNFSEDEINNFFKERS